MGPCWHRMPPLAALGGRLGTGLQARPGGVSGDTPHTPEAAGRRQGGGGGGAHGASTGGCQAALAAVLHAQEQPCASSDTRPPSPAGPTDRGGAAALEKSRMPGRSV